MPEIGARVKVLYPEYARGIEGIIEAEERAHFWIVRLKQQPAITDKNPAIHTLDNYPWLLSLQESDFELLG